MVLLWDEHNQIMKQVERKKSILLHGGYICVGNKVHALCCLNLIVIVLPSFVWLLFNLTSVAFGSRWAAIVKPTSLSFLNLCFYGHFQWESWQGRICASSGWLQAVECSYILQPSVHLSKEYGQLGTFAWRYPRYLWAALALIGDWIHWNGEYIFNWYK